MTRSQVILVLASWLALVAGCAERGGPIGTVERAHRAWRSGDLATVNELVDFQFRLREMLGEVWDQGTPADRSRAVAQAREMYIATTERLWKKHYQGRHVRTWISQRDSAGQVWVESQASGGGEAPFKWRYRLTRRGSTWRITQREYTLGAARSDTSAFYPMALRRIGKEYGRTPTLRELNANLPSLVGRMRVRQITIPKLPKAHSRAH